jgi:hypothetical protein
MRNDRSLICLGTFCRSSRIDDKNDIYNNLHQIKELNTRQNLFKTWS